jgi:cytochrome c oxidase subunit 2
VNPPATPPESCRPGLGRAAAGGFRRAVSAPRTARRLRWRALIACAVTTGLLFAEGGEKAWAGALLPERGGSPNADRIASLYTVVLVLAALVFAGVAVTLVFSLVRYRERRNRVPAQIRGNTRLEVGWTVAASGLIVFLAVFSFTKLSAIEHPGRAVANPAAATAGVGDGGRGALHIDVVGRQYVWMFKYPNGAFAYTEMVAPVGVTVELDIVSVDVAHSWWIPKLGGKFDAIPGYVNHTWFRIKRAGVYSGQCAELCGRNHANMYAAVFALPYDRWKAWYDRQARAIQQAKRLAAQERRRLEAAQGGQAAESGGAAGGASQAQGSGQGAQP